MTALPFKARGKIVYDPFRAGMKRRTDWWAVIEVDREITRYYRWWLHRRYHLQLDAPSWDAHISIFRGEKPSADLQHLWKKHHGRVVEFSYGPEMYKAAGNDAGGDFWVMDVDCPAVAELRKEMKKPYNWAPHLTIGRERV